MFFQDLYTPESSSGTPCSIGSTVMQGSHNGAVLCPRALPTVIKAMNKTKKNFGDNIFEIGFLSSYLVFCLFSSFIFSWFNAWRIRIRN